jgi:hypothetical protein
MPSIYYLQIAVKKHLGINPRDSQRESKLPEERKVFLDTVGF